MLSAARIIITQNNPPEVYSSYIFVYLSLPTKFKKVISSWDATTSLLIIDTKIMSHLKLCITNTSTLSHLIGIQLEESSGDLKVQRKHRNITY